MHSKKLAVVLAVLGVFGGLIQPAAITKADFVSQNPVTNAVAAIAPTISYEVYPMRITAYSSSPDETAYNPEYTASGLHVQSGFVASNLFPFGTRIEIPALFGNEVFTVEDRMAKRFQHTIDIWMTSKQKALVFGVAYAKIIVVGTSSLASYNPPDHDQAVIDATPATTQLSLNLR